MTAEVGANEQIIFSTILASIIILGTTANGIVLWVLFQEKNLRRSIATCFLANLMVIDLLNLVLVMPFSLASIITLTWIPPLGLEKLNAFIGTSVELVAMLALAVISLDRLVAVMKPLAYKARITVCKATQCNVYIWSQAILFSFIPIPMKLYIFNEKYMASTFVSKSTQMGYYVFMSFLIGCNFILSLCIILGTYFYIFRVARSHNRRISRAILPLAILRMSKTAATNSQKEKFRQREIRTATKILFVIGAFVLCHFPYASLRILELCRLEESVNIPVSIKIASKWAAFSKSSINPFIYFLQHKRFHKAFQKLMRRITARRNFDCSVKSRTKNRIATTDANTISSKTNDISDKTYEKSICKTHENTDRPHTNAIENGRVNRVNNSQQTSKQ